MRGKHRPQGVGQERLGCVSLLGSGLPRPCPQGMSPTIGFSLPLIRAGFQPSRSSSAEPHVILREDRGDAKDDHQMVWDYSLSCGSCTRELWPPVASLPVSRAVPPAQKAPGTAPPTRVGGLLRQDSRPVNQARSHTEVSSATRVGGLLRQDSRPGNQARSHTKVSSAKVSSPLR
jgi:hypothetical protein